MEIRDNFAGSVIIYRVWRKVCLFMYSPKKYQSSSLIPHENISYQKTNEVKIIKY
jgi:hypothetical protein